MPLRANGRHLGSSSRCGLKGLSVEVQVYAVPGFQGEVERPSSFTARLLEWSRLPPAGSSGKCKNAETGMTSSVVVSSKQWGRHIQDELREVAGGKGTLEPSYTTYFFIHHFKLFLKLLPVNSALVTQGARESNAPEVEN